MPKYLHILEVNAKEWFDKAAGNSYFSATIVLDDMHLVDLPFQYGYGNHYEEMAMDAINEQDLDLELGMHSLREFCEVNKIKLISNKQENCKKKEL